MKYMVLLVGDGPQKPWPTMTPEEQGAVMTRFEQFDAACAAREGVSIVAGEALDGPSTATVMRTGPDGAATLTEGPYAEVLEGLGGFYVLEAPDLDTVTDLLRVLPPYDMEIRPVVEYG